MKQKPWKTFALLAMACSVLLGACEQQSAIHQDRNAIRIGISLYDGYDTFIAELSDYATARAQELEAETGVTITLMIEAAEGRQEIQNSHVE